MLEFDEEMKYVLSLPLADGSGEWQWELCRPNILVARSVERSAALRRLFSAKLSSPRAPWSIILAHDEITPGAVLRPDNRRKFVCFYFSFHEFGHHAIRNELAWFLLGVARSSKVAKVAGGLSAAVKHIVRALTIGNGSLAEGIVLPLDTGPTMLFARFRNHLGDEAALSRGRSSFPTFLLSHCEHLAWSTNGQCHCSH